MKKIDRSKRFIEDGSGLRRILLSDMICKDCKHRIPQSESACKKFRMKSATVFKGQCPEYEKEDE